MDYSEIKKLIQDMGNANIDELNIEFPEGIKISMKKNNTQIINNNVVGEDHLDPIQPKTQTITNQKQEKMEEGKIIKSPMVGTFYSKPSPTSKAFVKVGDTVKKGDTLCIIEAMKLMNEIESEYDGEIAEILIKDGEVVEFGTPLFRIK